MPMSKEELIGLVRQISSESGAKMAIGGGIAVNAYGYRRETADVDAFFHRADQEKVLLATNHLDHLFSLPNEIVLEEPVPFHWTLTQVDTTPYLPRINLRLTAEAHEEIAVDTAVTMSYRGIPVDVFPVDLLVISKFLADRDDAKDSLDIYELLRRGAVDADLVVERLRQMGLDEDADRFKDFVEYVQQLPSKKRKK